MRLVAQRHGTGEHAAVYAAVARQGYVPDLAPDFAYIFDSPFYESTHFHEAYTAASFSTRGFTDVDADTLSAALRANPTTLLIFRTITGLTKGEFAQATALVGAPQGLKSISDSKVMSMESQGTKVTVAQATLAALTLTQIMDGTLFGQNKVGALRVKQDKPDTVFRWTTVADLARDGVPYEVLLHQRHYGGAFRQVLDATSTRRGNVLEDAVEKLFTDNGVPHIRTGSHNQGDIEKRFQIQVAPAPDFVVYDEASGTLLALLECKLVSDGGTARDKALRFERLRAEAVRLGGIPLVAVLSGMGWTRVNDTLGPVLRDTEGRVFTLSTLSEMLTLTPFPKLLGTAPSP